MWTFSYKLVHLFIIDLRISMNVPPNKILDDIGVSISDTDITLEKAEIPKYMLKNFVPLLEFRNGSLLPS